MAIGASRSTSTPNTVLSKQDGEGRTGESGAYVRLVPRCFRSRKISSDGWLECTPPLPIIQIAR
jgi:hypothetical protein